MSTVTFLDERRIRASQSTSRRLPTSEPSLLTRLSIAWQRRKTEKMLEGLPQEIRKDIGWPTTAGK